MKKRFVAVIAGALALPVPGFADEISDTLQAALDAYNAGDVAFALEEIDFARQKMVAMQADVFQQFLPEPPDGWTREIDSDMQAGLAMMGGGMGAGATYMSADRSQNYTITMMADNAMVMSMGAMVTNAAAMGMQLERVGRQRVAISDDQALALVNNRILVTAEGRDSDLLLDAMKSIDFAALSSFGQ